MLTGLMYNVCMKKGRLKEEDIAKISIIAKRLDVEFEDAIKLFLQKHMAKEKRGRVN
jgi:hypothetical protein